MKTKFNLILASLLIVSLFGCKQESKKITTENIETKKTKTRATTLKTEIEADKLTFTPSNPAHGDSGRT